MMEPTYSRVNALTRARARLVRWWTSKGRDLPLAADVDVLLRYDIPIEKLIAELEARWFTFRTPPRSLRAFFLLGEELQSQEHKYLTTHKPRGTATLQELLNEADLVP